MPSIKTRIRRLRVSKIGQDRYANQATKAAMTPNAGSANGSGAPSPISIRTSTAAGITIVGNRDRRRSTVRLRSLTAVRGADVGAD